MNKTIFATIAAILLIIFLLKDWSGCTEPTKLVNLDSLEAEHAEAMIAKDVQLTALQWEIRDLNMARRWDSVAIGRALSIVKPLTSKTEQLIKANRELKAANDTLARLNNCDTLAEYTGMLLVQVDSLQKLIPEYQSTIDDVVFLYEERDKAKDEKMEQMAGFYSEMRQAAENCQANYSASIKSEKRKRKTIIAIAAGVVITSLIIK